MRINFAKKLSAIALGALFFILGVRGAKADLIYNLTVDTCTGTCGASPFGQVDLAVVNSTTVSATVTLFNGDKFVLTGGPHAGFAWNINGDPAVSVTLPAGWTIGSTNKTLAGSLGIFNYTADCTSCGPGASNAMPGPFTFDISLASGLTPADFIANSAGSFFAADIIGNNGHTGEVGSNVPVPEPSTLILLGSGLLMAGTAGRRRFLKK